MADTGSQLDLRRLLASVEAAPPIEAVDVLAAELGRMVDADHVSLLIANTSGDAVVRLTHVTDVPGSTERTEALPLAGSVYERALVSQEIAVTEDGGGWLVLVPVTERGDALGLLELSLPRSPDNETVAYLVSAAHALAYVLIASRRHTDLFEWGQRDTPFSLAAEIQRRLLPSSYTIEAGPLTLAGWLEPAHDVGGDTFDYALGREHLYASITDAMGHSEQAALLATLSVGSLRNTRRMHASPAAQAEAANAAILAAAQPDQFVTGQLLRASLADGHVEIVNAGHPAPYLLRAGRAAPLELEVGLALGFLPDTTYEAQVLVLEPGDRLVLLTDGFLERNALPVDLTEILEQTADRHPREVVRELADNVLRATGGDLRDDATVLCIDWFGPDAEREATGDASRSRASAS